MRKRLRGNRTCEVLRFRGDSHGGELLFCWTHWRTDENGEYFFDFMGRNSKKHGSSCSHRRDFWSFMRRHSEDDPCEIGRGSRSVQDTIRSYASPYPDYMVVEHTYGTSGRYIHLRCRECHGIVWKSGRRIEVGHSISGER